jgi:hypothetical protein
MTGALCGCPVRNGAAFRREMEPSRYRVGVALRDRPLTETRRGSQLVESPDYTNHLYSNRS